MNYRLLLETAVLAGEIMLKSGAETHRVEDTMSRMLGTCGQQVEAIVMSTSIIAMISDPTRDVETLICQIRDRETFLNKIYLVNDVSRRLCGGKIDIETANQELKKIKETVQFNHIYNSICIIVVCALFPILLGGMYNDCLVGLVTGSVLSIIIYVGNKTKINPFVTNIVGATLISMLVIFIDRKFDNMFSRDLVIIGSIMPLLPGVSITNAVRDTLQGDFVSGGARVLEAFVKALAIVLGVGAGLAICGVF